MSIGFTIAGIGFEVEGGDVVEEAVRKRFAAFLDHGQAGGDVRISVESARFNPLFEVVEPISLVFDGGVARFEGAEYHLAARRGNIRSDGFGPVDAMVRLALSVELPRRGALLLHGAALPGGIALCGASGSGKSTAAAALGGACDELIVIYNRELLATPWWGGRPARTALKRLIALRRGGAARRALSGARALREVMTHAVRYLPSPDADRALLSAAAALCGAVPVEILECPEGGGFLPFLMEQV
jgi:hypothetical protein